MRYFRNCCQYAALALVLWISAGASAQPNVIVIMTDDQGYGDLGVTGNTILDKLAGQSVSFDRFYVSPVCTPTRASLMTGRYHHRTGALDTWRGGAMMRPDEVTLAEAMRDGGYATGIFGKWHLGDCYPMRAIDQGFDHALVHNGGGLAQPADPIENRGRYTDPILSRNGVEVQTQGYCTDVYFDEAFSFIEDKVKANKPFFAYIACNAPHGPFHDVPNDLYEKYKAKDLSPILLGHEGDADVVARVFAMVENVDQNVGRLMDELDRLKIADDTVLIFMLDNGPNTRRYVGDMRGKKGEVHDGGIRSPLFVRYPAKFKAGHRVTPIAAHIDVMPTLLDVAGVDAPEGVKMDGLSLLPLITAKPGENVAWPDRSIVIQAHRGRSPEAFHHCMVIADKWKLVRPSGFGRFSAGNQDVPFELYDVDADPTESKNLAEDHPEVFEKLKTQYLAWYEDVNGSNKELPRITVGTRHEPRTVLTRQDWIPYDAGWGTHGKWLLNAKQAQPVTATLLLRRPIEEDYPVTLTVGENTYTATFKKGTDKLAFTEVQIPDGLFELEAGIQKGDKAVGPWHIVVERTLPTLDVDLDVSGMPEAQGWGEYAIEESKRWYPQIIDLLGEDQSRPTNQIGIRFKRGMGYPAHAAGTNITISADWVERHPGDVGLVIHELVHTVQRYRGGPTWVTEGIADYIRYYHYEPGTRKAWFNLNNSHYTQGYQPTAAFFAWIEREHDGQLIQKLHRAMLDRSYNDGLFEQWTGKTLSQLWPDFIEAEKTRRSGS